MKKTKVDIDFIAVYGRTGIGKSTLGVSLSFQYSLANGRAPIYSNVPIQDIDGVHTRLVRKAADLLFECEGNPCTCPKRILLIDQFDNSFSSNVGWLQRERDQKLTALVTNARKHNVVAIIATAQGRRKIRNTFRLNCKYVVEPLGSLDYAECPEYFIWNDVELYEESGKARYEHAELCASVFPLEFLQELFDTRDIVPLEWE